MFKSLSTFCFYLLVITAAILPSEGGRGLLNPKAIALVLFVLSFTTYFFTERKVLERDLFFLSGFFLLLGGISTSVLVALFNGRIDPISIVDETKLFLITFLPFLGASVLQGRGLLTLPNLLKVLLYANVLYSLAKAGFLILLFLKVISFSTFLEVTGIRVMSLDVAGSFSRFLSSCDIFTPFLLFFVVARSRFGLKLSPLFVYFYIPLSLISIGVAFSRVFLFIGAFSLLLGVFLEFQKRAIISFYIAIFFTLSAVALLGPEKIGSMIELRLFSRENSSSDAVRGGQIKALLKETAEHPLLGLGMGGYSEEVIRDKEIRHLYEVQWLALLAQFGCLGLPILLCPVFVLFFTFLRGTLTLERLFLFLLFLGWTASGATNPFVLSLASGVMYTLFALGLKYLETSHLRHTAKNVHPPLAREPLLL